MTDDFGNRIIIHQNGNSGFEDEPDIIEGPMWIGPVYNLQPKGNPDHAPIQVRSVREIIRHYLMQINPTQFKRLLDDLPNGLGNHLLSDMPT